jgi:hypothetical protein
MHHIKGFLAHLNQAGFALVTFVFLCDLVEF